MFSIADNVKVQILQPTDGEFTLNFSLLNGPDLLGAPSSTKNWVDVQAEVGGVEWERAVMPGEGYYLPAAAVGTVNLRTEVNNPDLNNRIYVGLPLRIRILDGVTWTTRFTGQVTNMITSYEPGFVYPTISLALGDNLDSLLNTLLVVDYPVQTAYARTQAIQTSLASIGMTQLINAPVTFYSQNVQAITGTLSVQELLAPILQYYRAYTEQTYSDAYQSYVYRIYDGADAIPTGASGATLTMDTPTTAYETTYSTLDVSFEPENIFNQIIISDEAGTVYAQTNNFDSQLISGVQAIYSTWAFVNNSSIAPAWAEQIVAETDTRVLSNITFNGVNRFGNITYVATAINIDGPKILNVKQTQYGVNRRLTSLVTRQAHNIDPNGWTITLDLWKGYKYA